MDIDNIKDENIEGENRKKIIAINPRYTISAQYFKIVNQIV